MGIERNNVSLKGVLIEKGGALFLEAGEEEGVEEAHESDLGVLVRGFGISNGSSGSSGSGRERHFIIIVNIIFPAGKNI